jgi:hypothetical protein
MAKTSAQLRASYDAYTPLISGFASTGDPNDLKNMIDKSIDYNRELRAQQAGELTARGQIVDRYNSTVDPLINGMDVSARERLKSYDIQGNNARAAELGDYMAAREGSVADTVNAWKTAWDSRYAGMKEQQSALKDAWSMASDEEKELQRRKEAAASLAAQYASINAQKEKDKPEENIVAEAQRAMAAGLGWHDAAAQVEKKYGKIAPNSGVDRLFNEWYRGIKNTVG